MQPQLKWDMQEDVESRWVCSSLCSTTKTSNYNQATRKFNYTGTFDYFLLVSVNYSESPGRPLVWHLINKKNFSLDLESLIDFVFLVSLFLRRVSKQGFLCHMSYTNNPQNGHKCHLKPYIMSFLYSITVCVLPRIDVFCQIWSLRIDESPTLL